MRWFFGLLCLCLLACSPLWDWREVYNQDHGYIALFPAKPAQGERMVSLSGTSERFYLQTAQVQSVTFAIGVLTPTSIETLNADQVQQSLQQAFLQNFGAKLIRSEQVGRVVEMTSPPATVIWTHWWAEGKLPDGKPIRVQARWAVYRHHVWQMMLVAPQSMDNQAIDDLADMWFPGMRWTR